MRQGGPEKTRWIWPAAVFLAAIVLVLRAAPSITLYNSTIDEPYHIGSAVALYESGAHVMGVQHGPLPRLVAGLPLFLAGARHALPGDRSMVHGENLTYWFGQQVLFHGPVPYWRVLILSRWAMLLVFPPLCLLYVFLVGRWLGGPRVGAAAAVFFSLDPTLLGHAIWVCTDVAACAGFLAALYHGLRWLERPTVPLAAAAGVALGLAVSCKFSCALVLPCLGLLSWIGVDGDWKTLRRRFFRSTGVPPVPAAPGTGGTPVPRFAQFLLVIATAFVALWATYLFSVGPMDNQDVFDPAAWHRVPAVIARFPVPMPSFWLGLIYLFGHDLHGHATYINGRLGFRGHWYYFPEAIGLKEPLALLAAVLLSAVLLTTVDRRRWRAAAAVLAPAGLFLAAAMQGNLDIGIRHMLPVIPCLYLFACIMIGGARVMPGKTSTPRHTKTHEGTRSESPGCVLRPLNFFVCLRVPWCRFVSTSLSAMWPDRRIWWGFGLLPSLIVAEVIETVPQRPDYLSYFNALAGGPTGGERYLIDSNLDWGQDVARLAAYLKSPAAAGRPYTIRLFDLRADALAAAVGLRPEAETDPPAGLFAISVNVRHRLFGLGASPDGKLLSLPPDYDWVTRYPHVARIGSSIDVYDLTGEPVLPSASTSAIHSTFGVGR